MQKALLIFLIIILGLVFNIGHQYTFLIRYNLMIMLFFVFLNTTLELSLFRPAHFKVLILNIILPILLYCAILPLDEDYASIAFIISITPTAAAAPVIGEIMKVRVAILTIAVLLGTPLVALIIPIMLVTLMDISGEIDTIDLVLPVVSLVFIPLIASQIIRKLSAKLTDFLKPFNRLSFPLFLLNVFIACGNASHFIQNSEAIGLYEIIQIFGVVVIIGSLQFQIGHFVGTKGEELEFSLAMGRKNTMIALWLALTYFNPIVAIGPICYIIFHNAYNSIQIWQRER